MASGYAHRPRRRIAVLGCGGFIGSHLVERLLAAGEYSVVGLDRTAAKLRSCCGNPRFRFVQADVRDENALRAAVRECDTVVSLAALCNPSQYNTVPVDVIEMSYAHPVALARVCAEQGVWLVHFSTCEVYGKTVEGLIGADVVDAAERVEFRILSEERSPLILGPVQAQRWTYACAKQLTERVIYAYGAQKGLAFTIVRPFNFIGPRMDYVPGIDGEGTPRVLACFMNALMREQPLKLVDGGRARRAFTYIADAMDAMMVMFAHPDRVIGRILNIGNPDNEISIAALAQLMIRLYEEVRPETAGRHRTEVVRAQDFYGPGYEDCDRRVPDIRLARELLGWRPSTDLVTALRRTVESYVAAYEGRIAAQLAC